MYAYRTETIERNGHSFRVEHFHYEDMGAPWIEHDGHGIVSDWTTRDKRPGEVVISSDRHSKRFYDIQATMNFALRDGWSLGTDDLEKYRKRTGKTIVTAREVCAESVRLDMERMRAWCNDEWHWMGIVVTPLDAEGNAIESRSQSLWGIESDSPDYHAEVAAELADQCDMSPIEA